jgi:hypothetical protein
VVVVVVFFSFLESDSSEPSPKDRIYIIAASNEHAAKIRNLRKKILEDFGRVKLIATPPARVR